MRRLSIRSQLLVLATSTIVVILIIILHSYSMMSGMITQNHEQYIKQTVTEIQKNVASNKDVINRLMQSISYSEDVQTYLVEKDNVYKYELFKKLNNYLSSQRELKDGIMDIVLSGNDGAWIDLSGGNRYVSELRKALPPKTNSYYAGRVPFASQNGLGESLVFATTIYYLRQGELFNTNVGTLFFIIDPKALVGDKGFPSKQSSTQIYLLDREHKVVSHNSQAEVGTELQGLQLDNSLTDGKLVDWDNKQYVVQTEPLPEISGSIVSMVPKNELLKDLWTIQKQEIVILGLCLLILAVPFMFIINNILLPLRKLMFFMTIVKRGDLLKLKRRVSLQGYLEISMMAAEFNSMLDEIDQLTQRLIETNSRLYHIELEKKKSELAFLRSQIHPHFLYNTLEAITGIAAMEGQSKIKTMTRSLSSIFRYSIKGNNIVPLAQEIRMIEAYVSIQQIRFGDRFTVHYQFTEEALAYAVPRMILQPIVENAVFHGFEPTLRKGDLWMEGSVDEEGRLVLTVQDNGIGMEPGRLKEIQALLAAPSSIGIHAEDERSIGLVNVSNRIKIMYGDECGLQIDSRPGEGTHIRMTIGEKRDDHA
ncbi:sensor histidine kinase [Paenibacillus filicis]|uniref:sensor histidine kinase n=1 Tax=Paenibacillus filicis TaxID=669464 RepID=UPI003119C061